jgi:hypothetical protein
MTAYHYFTTKYERSTFQKVVSMDEELNEATGKEKFFYQKETEHKGTCTRSRQIGDLNGADG